MRLIILLITVLTFVRPQASAESNINTNGDCAPVVLETGGNVTVVCNLGNQGPKFRITYYRINSLAAFSLIKGTLPPDVEALLGGQQAIIRTPVTDEVAFFLKEFGLRQYGDYIQIERSPGLSGNQTGPVEENSEVSFDHYVASLSMLQKQALQCVNPEGEIDLCIAAFDNETMSEGIPLIHPSEHAMLHTSTWPDDLMPILDGSPEGGRMFAPNVWRWLQPQDITDYKKRFDLQLIETMKRYGAEVLAGNDELNEEEKREKLEEDMELAKTQALDDYRIIQALLYLSQSGMPSAFALVHGDNRAAHDVWQLRVHPRSYEVLIAVIENTSTQSIHIGEFGVRQLSKKDIRTHEVSEAELDQAALEQRNLYPVGVLSPKEKIVIPIRIELPFSNEIKFLLEEIESTMEQGSEIWDQIQEEYGNMLIFEFSTDLEAEIEKDVSSLPRPEMPSWPERYEFGPALRLETVQADGHEFRIRQHDPNNFMMVAGFLGGTCPVAMSYQPETGAWLREGAFIVGSYDRQNPKTDLIRLEHFKGTIRISEFESEISFIDQAGILIEDDLGRARIQWAKQKHMSAVDDSFQVLTPGTSVTLEFNPPIHNETGSRYSFVATGFYVPLAGGQFAAANSSE